jgi:hypothetical protein
VLARTLEAKGLSTIIVTMMPYWAERIGTPRCLAVAFPFGHTLGQPHDSAGQMRVIREALRVLESAQNPGEIVHSPEEWPVKHEEALKSWQPAQPSPIIAALAPDFRKMLRERRRDRK